jgi:hypothetical protein
MIFLWFLLPTARRQAGALGLEGRVDVAAHGDLPVGEGPVAYPRCVRGAARRRRRTGTGGK